MSQGAGCKLKIVMGAACLTLGTVGAIVLPFFQGEIKIIDPQYMAAAGAFLGCALYVVADNLVGCRNARGQGDQLSLMRAQQSGYETGARTTAAAVAMGASIASGGFPSQLGGSGFQNASQWTSAWWGARPSTASAAPLLTDASTPRGGGFSGLDCHHYAR